MTHEIELIDHIGWDLWRATQAWKQKFATGMAAKGHLWFLEARSNLIVHIDRSGIRQSLLVQRSGLSKQAVQQFVDELEADGIVQRARDPADARGKRVVFTVAGLAALRDANAVKRQIERDYENRLGKLVMEDLGKALRLISAE